MSEQKGGSGGVEKNGVQKGGVVIQIGSFESEFVLTFSESEFHKAIYGHAIC